MLTKFDELSLIIVVQGINEYADYHEDKTRKSHRRNDQREQLVVVGLVP